MTNPSQQMFLGDYDYTYPLDLVTGAYGAYSVLKLRSAYTGNCLKVRRSSDNATQDIGFVGNRIDIGAITTFISGGSGYVDIWYDQSGNTRNSDSISTSLQPQINNRTINNIPVLDFAGAQVVQADTLAGAVTGEDNPYTSFLVAYNDSPATNTIGYNFFSRTSTNTPIQYLSTLSSSYQQGKRDDANSSVSTTGGTITSSLVVLSTTFPGTTVSLDYNFTNAINAVSLDKGSITLDRVSIGGRYFSSAYSQFLDGAIGGYILYDTALSEGNKNLVRNCLIQNWGISA